jgi:hypothetical protein
MKVFILIFLLAIGGHSQAQIMKPEINLNGEADFFLEEANSPSSIRGQTRFDFGLLQISPSIRIRDDLSLNIRFDLAEERSTTEKNYLNEVQNAFIRYHDTKFEKLTHEVGLIRSAWIETEGFAAVLDMFGNSGRSLVRRYGFIGEGDLGYQGRYQMSDKLFFILGGVNGEENKDSEQGPNKEFFGGAFYHDTSFRAQLWLSSGRVDRTDSGISEKKRAILRLEKTMGRLMAAIEGVYAEDPSTDLEANHRLEGISFTELVDQRKIRTSGGRIEAAYDLNESQKIVLRYDHLTPQWERKHISSAEAAWIKRETENMQWGLFYEKTDLGVEHSLQSKTREWVRAALGINF